VTAIDTAPFDREQAGDRFHLRMHERESGFEIASVHGVEDAVSALDVLLRHRPRSISRCEGPSMGAAGFELATSRV
jgi:hypothetical protein